MAWDGDEAVEVAGETGGDIGSGTGEESEEVHPAAGEGDGRAERFADVNVDAAGGGEYLAELCKGKGAAKYKNVRDESGERVLME